MFTYHLLKLTQFLRSHVFGQLRGEAEPEERSIFSLGPHRGSTVHMNNFHIRTKRKRKLHCFRKSFIESEKKGCRGSLVKYVNLWTRQTIRNRDPLKCCEKFFRSGNEKFYLLQLYKEFNENLTVQRGI